MRFKTRTGCTDGFEATRRARASCLLAHLLVACLGLAGRYNEDVVTPAQQLLARSVAAISACLEIAIHTLSKAGSRLEQRTTTSPQVPLADGCLRKLVKQAHEEAVGQADLGGGADGHPGDVGAQGLGSRHACLEPVFMEAVATPGSSIIHLAQTLQPGVLPDVGSTAAVQGLNAKTS